MLVFFFVWLQAEDTRVQKAIEQILVEHSDILNRKTDGTCTRVCFSLICRCFVKFKHALLNFHQGSQVFAQTLQNYWFHYIIPSTFCREIKMIVNKFSSRQLMGNSCSHFALGFGPA